MIYTHLKTGDIVAFRRIKQWWNPMSWLSQAIRRIAKVRYNHVGVIAEINNKMMLFEARGRGVMVSKVVNRIEDVTYTDEFAVFRRNEHVNERKILDEALEIVGWTRYDFIGLLFQWFYNYTGIWIGPLKRGAKKRMYCYELMAYLHRDTKTFAEWHKVKPADLFSTDEYKLIYSSE